MILVTLCSITDVSPGPTSVTSHPTRPCLDRLTTLREGADSVSPSAFNILARTHLSPLLDRQP